jgi:hypothetical protein
MPPELLAEFSRAGVATRQCLLDLGVPPSEIRRLLARGELVRVRRGVYTSRGIWDAADRIGRCRLASRAAVRTMRRGWVLSHDSAAYELNLPILPPKVAYVHITRPGFTNAWTEFGVKHHLARFNTSQLVELGNGISALDLARTAVDIARERGRRDGLVACDAALRLGATQAQLDEAVEPMTNWPGSVGARWAVRAADPGAESMLESLGRELVLEAGIGEPETQFPVRTARGVRWCDIRVGNLLVECESLIKLVPPGEGGVAKRPAPEVVFEQQKRARAMKDEDFGLTQIYWADHWGSARAEAIKRLRREYADTVARFGPDLPLARAREAAELRAKYGDRRTSA